VNDRLIEADVLERNTLSHELERVVLDTDVADAHRLAAVEHYGDVLELDAVEQASTEATDRQLAVEGLVRMPHDESAQPATKPRRLRRQHRGGARADQQHRRDDQGPDPSFRHMRHPSERCAGIIVRTPGPR
jgi:hypothetical protein